VAVIPLANTVQNITVYPHATEPRAWNVEFITSEGLTVLTLDRLEVLKLYFALCKNEY
jgi:hypothetical protein